MDFMDVPLSTFMKQELKLSRVQSSNPSLPKLGMTDLTIYTSTCAKNRTRGRRNVVTAIR